MGTTTYATNMPGPLGAWEPCTKGAILAKVQEFDDFDILLQPPSSQVNHGDQQHCSTVPKRPSHLVNSFFLLVSS